MSLEGLDHYTIRVAESELEPLHRFYVEVLGLREGPRPDFSFPGHWLYATDHPIVHLAATAPVAVAGASGGDTGCFDHVAFRASGLAEMRERLAQRGVKWHELPVPGFPLHQLFLFDPVGIRLELTFDAAEAADAPRA